MLTLFTFNVIKIFIFFVLSAGLSLFFAPVLIKFLNKIQFWKKEARNKTITGEDAKIFYSLHKERETTVPRGGGILIWGCVLILIFLFFGLSFIKEPWWLKKFNFLSRSETWLPLFALITASLVGLLDDILCVFNKDKHTTGKGLTILKRLLIVSLIGLIGGLWFYFKLEWSSIHIPLLFNFPEGIDLQIGFWIIFLFILVMIACWSGGIVDGIDGLAGGIFGSIFAGFSIIAFSQGQIDLAIFCTVILGTLFGFLWFNIPPAHFYLGETGVLGLTSTMAVIAFLTNSVAVLPIMAGILVIEVSSVILQLLSKKIYHKKIWLSTPIHHHLEAKGWTGSQITMRLWIISIVFVILGVAIRLLSY